MSSFLAALLVASLLTPVVIGAAHRLALLDHPNERSLHSVPVPRAGGVAVALAALSGVAISRDWSGDVGVAVLVAATLGAIGLVDDRYGLPPLPRLVAQMLVPLAAIVALAGMSIVWACLSALIIAGYVNAFNFMDGINGISALQATVLGVFLALLPVGASATGLGAAGWAIAGASLGFLPFNAFGARVFLGDVGSYFVGAWLSTVAVLAIEHGANALVVLGPFMLYLADTAAVLVKRALRRESLLEAHREHTYQRLVQAGWSHQTVALLTGGLTTFNAVVMLSLGDEPRSTQMVGLTCCSIGVVAYLLLPTVVAMSTGETASS